MKASTCHRSFIEMQWHEAACERCSLRRRLFAIGGCFFLSTLTVILISGRPILAQASGPSHKSDATLAGDVENGKRIFENQGCQKCHGSEGQGGARTQKQGAAPQISPSRFSLPTFLQFVRRPTGQMPPFSTHEVSDAQLTDLYAFLQSVRPSVKAGIPSSASAKNGQRLYADFGCYECHNGEGQGSVSTGGSRLGPPEIPFAAFVSYVRQPTNQMPPYTAKVVSDAELADIYAFLRSLPKPLPSKDIPLLNQ
jgi:mono/diheme cytochrome c family protein